MAVKQVANGFLTGLSGDTKPTTYPAGTRFFETNTGAEFYYTGSAWSAMATGGGGTPSAHATSHKSGGTDVIKLDEFGATTDITTLNASTGAHGLLPKLSNAATDFLNGTGAWSVPAGGGGGLTSPANIAGVNFADVGITNASSPYTVLDTKTVIRVDASGGNVVMNLPTAVGIAGRLYKIYRTDIGESTNTVTIDPNSTETIDSNPTYLLYPAEWVQIESDGANWQVIARPSVVNSGYFFVKGATTDKRYIGGAASASCALTNSTTAPLVNTLWALPVFIAKTTKFDTISFRVSTVASAGGVARAGIYRDNGNNYPGPLMFDTGSIAADTGNIKNTTISTTAPSTQIFQPGLYWLVWECGTAAPQIRCFSSNSGLSTVGGYDAGLTSNLNTNYGYSVAHTFGALPDPYTAGASLLNATPSATVPIPVIGLKPV